MQQKTETRSKQLSLYYNRMYVNKQERLTFLPIIDNRFQAFYWVRAGKINFSTSEFYPRSLKPGACNLIKLSFSTR